MAIPAERARDPLPSLPPGGGASSGTGSSSLLRRNHERKKQIRAEIAEEEHFVFLYYSLSTQLSVASHRDGVQGTLSTAGTMAGLLNEWEDSATLVKGTCIHVEIVSEDGRLQDLYFQRPNKVSQYWGVRETNEAFQQMMYECNRSGNAEEKVRPVRFGAK